MPELILSTIDPCYNAVNYTPSRSYSFPQLPETSYLTLCLDKRLLLICTCLTIKIAISFPFISDTNTSLMYPRSTKPGEDEVTD